MDAKPGKMRLLHLVTSNHLLPLATTHLLREIIGKR